MAPVLKRYFRKHKLAFAIQLSHALLRRYGGEPSYTAGQVRRTVDDLGSAARSGPVRLRRVLQ